MKNCFIKDILVFVLIVAVIFIACLFLPERVPIHFNAQGEADIIVNKYFYYLVRSFHTLHIGVFCVRRKEKINLHINYKE
jgi:uncharacterized membrane protein